MLQTVSVSRPTPVRAVRSSTALRPVEVAAKKLIHEAHDWGKSYRVISGAVRLDEVGAHGERLAGLALPGDLLGGEMLLLGTYAFRARALVPCVLQPWPSNRTDPVDAELLQELVRQQHRMPALLALRQGMVESRIERCLALLAGPVAADTKAPQLLFLPTLRDLAEITDTTMETASRIITKLRQRGVLLETERRQFWFRAAHGSAAAAELAANPALSVVA